MFLSRFKVIVLIILFFTVLSCIYFERIKEYFEVYNKVKIADKLVLFDLGANNGDTILKFFGKKNQGK